MQRTIDEGTRVVITKTDRNRFELGKLCVVIDKNNENETFLLRQFRDKDNEPKICEYTKNEFMIIYDQDLYEKNYEDGLLQAWNLMVSILSTEMDEEIFSPVVKKLYGTIHYTDLCNMNPFKVFSDIEKYEEALPEYGDVIEYRRTKYVIIEDREKEEEFVAMSPKKETITIHKRQWKDIKKTGRNISDQLNNVFSF